MDKLNPAELFVPEIRELLKAKDLHGLKIMLPEINPIDLADAFAHFLPQEQVLLLRLLDHRRALIVFEELETLQQEYLLHHFGDENLVTLIGDLPADMRQRLLRPFPDLT